ncbi:MAG: hypothetical protein NW206_12785 [Hyphomonadaceae bacterium]|nr:hypothetical protein [Hyphomonadaceae bacterium]
MSPSAGCYRQKTDKRILASAVLIYRHEKEERQRHLFKSANKQQNPPERALNSKTEIKARDANHQVADKNLQERRWIVLHPLS